MRYGKPDVKERIGALLAEGCDRILRAALSAIFRRHLGHRLRPCLSGRSWRCAGSPRCGSRRPTTIRTSMRSRRAKRDLRKLRLEPEVILVSFHGVPKEYLLKRDPYHCHCVKTWRLAAQPSAGCGRQVPDELPVPLRHRRMACPTRTGPSRPLAKSGVKRLAMVAPVSPPIASRRWKSSTWRTGRLSHNGGEHFAYLPCLNDSEDGMRVIRNLVEREMPGWHLDGAPRVGASCQGPGRTAGGVSGALTRPGILGSRSARPRMTPYEERASEDDRLDRRTGTAPSP